MANLTGSQEKIIILMGEKGTSSILGRMDINVPLSGSTDKTVSLIGEFGVGFKTMVWILVSGTWNDAGVWKDGSTWNDGS